MTDKQQMWDDFLGAKFPEKPKNPYPGIRFFSVPGRLPLILPEKTVGDAAWEFQRIWELIELEPWREERDRVRAEALRKGVAAKRAGQPEPEDGAIAFADFCKKFPQWSADAEAAMIKPPAGWEAPSDWARLISGRDAGDDKDDDDPPSVVSIDLGPPNEGPPRGLVFGPSGGPNRLGRG